MAERPNRRPSPGDNDRVTLVAQYDETGQSIDESSALGDHPDLLSFYLSRKAISCELDAETADPPCEA